MGYNVSIIGFHGTTENNANMILKDKHFIPTVNKAHWLGQGVYFFREDVDQAMSWAITQTKRREKEKPTVLRVEINVKNKFFLNLNSREHLFKLKHIIKKMEKDLREIDFGLEGNEEALRGHIYRCAVLDLIPIEVVKVIQNNFPLEQPGALETLEFKQMGVEMHSIQVCVRDHDLIKEGNIFLHSQQEMPPRGRRERRRTARIKY